MTIQAAFVAGVQALAITLDREEHRRAAGRVTAHAWAWVPPHILIASELSDQVDAYTLWQYGARPRPVWLPVEGQR